ncbi:MAG: radical SAM family heme chaperone HemW, partial [Candidatus Eisenbacteria sp.]|nr:radical SAM family heme chaperone HemW [Candidatus Eisenbacteria bacterium]
SVQSEPHRFDPYLRALANEWQLLREETGWDDSDQCLTSIYVGGGTPSVLGSVRLRGLLDIFRDPSRWADDCEITVELNPEGASYELFTGLLAAGYSRFSLGLQSFRDAELSLLGRGHDAQQGREAVHAARRAGCRNLNLDLMYGLPGQSIEQWTTSLQEAIALEPAHISCYLLTLEEETILHQLLHGGELETPFDEILLKQYMVTRDLALAAGFEHYEISNFARPGFRCRHNVATWRRRPYYGLGPAAHSFDGALRWCNAANLTVYLEHLLEAPRRPPRERYSLTPADEAKEMILLGLRMAEGLKWSALEGVTARGALARLRRRARLLYGTGFLNMDAEGLRLAPQAYFVSNSVFVELIRALEEDDS